MTFTVRDPSSDPPPSPDRLLIDAARAAQDAQDRVATALADLFLHDEQRLSDEQRLTMARLLGALIEAIEDELRRGLLDRLDLADLPELEAALGSARLAIAGPVLDRSLLLHDADLIALLLRRADEHRIGRRLAAAHGGAVLDDLMIETHGEPVAAAAMALLLAESRRFDRFADPVLARTDLPAELQHRLVWRVAAALRDYLLGRHPVDPIAADRAIVAAATGLLAGYDETETLEGRALALALALREAGGLDDRLLGAALAEGRLALFVAALGLRAAIDPATAWEMLVDRDGSRLALALSAIECERDVAADILLRLALADGGEEDRPGDLIAAFERLDPAHARAAIAPWRLDADYRRAIATLAAGRSR